LAGAGAVEPLPLPQPGTDTVAAVVTAIKVLQAALKPWGYTGAIDGDWGDGTEAAWQAYENRA